LPPVFSFTPPDNFASFKRYDNVWWARECLMHGSIKMQGEKIFYD